MPLIQSVQWRRNNTEWHTFSAVRIHVIFFIHTLISSKLTATSHHELYHVLVQLITKPLLYDSLPPVPSHGKVAATSFMIQTNRLKIMPLTQVIMMPSMGTKFVAIWKVGNCKDLMGTSIKKLTSIGCFDGGGHVTIVNTCPCSTSVGKNM